MVLIGCASTYNLSHLHGNPYKSALLVTVLLLIIFPCVMKENELTLISFCSDVNSYFIDIIST